MQIEFQNAKKDYFQLYNFQVKKSIQKYPAGIVIITLWMAITAGGKPFSWENFVFGLFLFPAFLGILYIIIYCKFIYSLNRSTSKEESYREKKTADITDDGLLITYFTGNTKTYKWEKIVRIHSNDNAIYIELTDKRTFLINKRCFSNESESRLFIDEIEKHFSKNSGWINTKPLSVQDKPPFWMGYLCLIPLIGAFVGVALIVNGLIKYKNKWLVIMGFGGIAFTVAIYSSFNFYINSESNRKAFAPLFQGQLNTLMKEVEFYKLQHGVYPDSLGQMKMDDESVSILDPLQSMNDKAKDKHYNYKKVGNKYYLFSSGIDGIPNTSDDMYPKIAVADTGKFGLIIKH